MSYLVSADVLLGALAAAFVPTPLLSEALAAAFVPAPLPSDVKFGLFCLVVAAMLLKAPAAACVPAPLSGDFVQSVGFKLLYHVSSDELHEALVVALTPYKVDLLAGEELGCVGF
eukprot:scaffold43607_cov20-Tisochrysis_lutea.AAC.1